jgi:hypothetical protein
MVRRESLSLLMREEERHSVFVENRMIDGCVDYTFDFQYIVYQCQVYPKLLSTIPTMGLGGGP